MSDYKQPEKFTMNTSVERKLQVKAISKANKVTITEMIERALDEYIAKYYSEPKSS